MTTQDLLTKIQGDFAAREADENQQAVSAFRNGGHPELAEEVVRLSGTEKRLKFSEGDFYKYDKLRGIWDSEGVRASMWKLVHEMNGREIMGKDSSLTLRVSDIKGALTCAEYRVRDDRFFEAPRVGLACANGFVVVADDGAISVEPHSLDHRARAHYPLDFEANAPAPGWERFLSSLFEGDEDASQKIAYLQELMGVYLFGRATQFAKKGGGCAILLGGGANGKSTLIEVLAAMFPPGSTCSIPPDEWANAERIAHMAGKLLNVCAELPAGRMLHSDRLKAVITGDEVTGEKKYQDSFQVKPVAGHLWACNKLPVTSDQSEGFWRRFTLLTFNRKFSGESADMHIGQRLLENERAGILAWIVRGAERAFKAKAYTKPASHEAVKEMWRKSSDSVRSFVLDMTELSEKVETPAAEIFMAYKNWADDCGYKAVAQNTFGERLAEMGIPRAASKRKVTYALLLSRELDSSNRKARYDGRPAFAATVARPTAEPTAAGEKGILAQCLLPRPT